VEKSLPTDAAFEAMEDHGVAVLCNCFKMLDGM
jgi:hypothetical protein